MRERNAPQQRSDEVRQLSVPPVQLHRPSLRARRRAPDGRSAGVVDGEPVRPAWPEALLRRPRRAGRGPREGSTNELRWTIDSSSRDRDRTWRRCPLRRSRTVEHRPEQRYLFTHEALPRCGALLPRRSEARQFSARAGREYDGRRPCRAALQPLRTAQTGGTSVRRSSVAIAGARKTSISRAWTACFPRMPDSSNPSHLAE